jgi:hypothetical protein
LTQFPQLKDVEHLARDISQSLQNTDLLTQIEKDSIFEYVEQLSKKPGSETKQLEVMVSELSERLGSVKPKS